MTERDPADGFLSRWSRRKAQVARGEAVAPAAPAPAPAAMPAARPPLAVEPAAPAQPVRVAEPATPPPTMDEVAQLTPQSDFRRFVAPGTDAEVQRSALKKLFADPHFNVMDGLDTYIDDYSQADPMPVSMLRQLAQARALGLLDDELEPQPKPTPTPTPDSPAVPHEDPDLQLQPDDAAGRPEPDPGPDPPGH